MKEEPQVTRNIYEIRQDRLVTGWTVEFDRIKKRDRIPIILLVSLIALEVAHWLIF
ncbi:MAG: hypothetical protein V3W28_06675 [Thermoplasmata archaeon]